ncbi:MAG: hypothetical protein ABSF14_01880 [Terriglobia bacterium]|jgi:hypothetical protein
MAFKEFQRKRTHSGESAVSITKYGNFVLNATCIEKFFKEIKYAKLYWDAEARKVGIKPMKRKDEYSYSINFSPKGGVGTFSGTAFLKTYKLKYGETKSFLVSWNGTEELLELKVG